MNKYEIRLVKGRLGEYPALRELAAEADKNALMMQVAIDHVGTPKSPVIDPNKVPVQNHKDTATAINEMISDQMEFEAEAKKIREKMREIENFIYQNVQEEKIPIFTARFIVGLSYDEMVPGFARSITGIQSIIDRELAGMTSEKVHYILF